MSYDAHELLLLAIGKTQTQAPNVKTTEKVLWEQSRENSKALWAVPISRIRTSTHIRHTEIWWRQKILIRYGMWLGDPTVPARMKPRESFVRGDIW